MKNNFGSSNCHLLQINSKPLNKTADTAGLVEFDPWLQYCKYNELYTNTLNKLAETNIVNNELSSLDPLSELSEDAEEIPNNSISVKRHGECLAPSDHDRIKTFISEFLQRGLVPYVERTIKVLNDQIQSKKSILKSFGLPRRIFGSASSTASSSKSTLTISASGIGSNQNNISISSLNSSSPNSSIISSQLPNDELQLRRVADLAFMFRLYDLAYNSYHSCKKEFTTLLSNTNSQNSDQILTMNMYLAGALEMASLANFMQNFHTDSSFLSQSSSSNSLSSLSSNNSNKSYNTQYIDDSIQMFLNVCKNSYFATRTVLLSTEALRANSMFLKAAYQFISLSNDESDIRSALFLEQAALCYLAMPQPLIRKYAFFMSIAGFRYSKAGQVMYTYIYRKRLHISAFLFHSSTSLL